MRSPNKVSARASELLRLARWQEWTVGKISIAASAMLTGIALGDLDFLLALRLLTFFLCVGAFGYLANDWCDRDVDRAVGKRNLFNRLGAGRSALVLVGTAAALAVSARAACDTAEQWTLLAAQMVATLAYSAPPLRLKARGFAGLACVFLAQYLLPLMLGLSWLSTLNALDWAVFLGFVGLSGAALEIGHQRWHAESDRRVGIATFAVVSRTAASLDRWYVGALRLLEVFTLIVPVYIGMRISAANTNPWLWLFVAPLAWIGVLLALAIRRYRWRTRDFADPFYGNSLGNAPARLFIYYPNCFLPAYLSCTFVLVERGDWRYGVVALLWARFTLYQMPLARHLEEIRRLFLPPELSWPGPRPMDSPRASTEPAVTVVDTDRRVL